MKTRLSQLLGLGFIFIFLVSCHTTIHVNNPNRNTESKTKSIDNVFVLINSVSFPDEFIDSFVPNLEAELQNKGIRATVREDSGIELNPVTDVDLKDYSNLMTIRIFYIYRNEGSFFRMAVKVVDLGTNQEIMNATVSVDSWIGLGIHSGWGEYGSKNTAEKLVEKMQQLGIL